MTENEKPKTDGIKWWLIVLTAISGTIWGLIIWDLGLPKNFSDFLGAFFLFYLSTPTMLLLSWILWWREKRGFSVLLSIFQVFISSYIFFMWIMMAAYL